MKIISKINKCIIKLNRNSEIIQNITNIDSSVFAESTHTRVTDKKEFQLCHIFLDFNN